MAAKRDNPANGSKLITAVVAAIGAFLGGGGVLAVYVGSPIGQQVVRPDPYTGTQAATLEHRIATVERRVDKLPPRELEFAVKLLRTELDDLERRVEKLEN